MGWFGWRTRDSTPDAVDKLSYSSFFRSVCFFFPGSLALIWPFPMVNFNLCRFGILMVIRACCCVVWTVLLPGIFSLTVGGGNKKLESVYPCLFLHVLWVGHFLS